MVATVRVMSPEEIAARAGGEVPFLRTPERGSAFADRQMRLMQLAINHPMQDFLRFTADLCGAQQALLSSYPSVPVPDAAALDRAAREGVPPIPAIDWPRDPAWREGLRRLVRDLTPRAPAGVRPALDTIAGSDDDWMERQADCLLANVMQGLDLATAPVVAAALQVYFTHLVIDTGRRHLAGGQPFGRVDDARSCPCCGSRPTVSVTRTHGGAIGQRYLHCSLCGTEWHMVRARCTCCGDSEKIAYQSLEFADQADSDEPGGRASQAAVQAECCDACGHYLKILHTDRNPLVEPLADDLASLTLDLLVSDSGARRHGVNLLLLFGEPPPEPHAAASPAES